MWTLLDHRCTNTAAFFLHPWAIHMQHITIPETLSISLTTMPNLCSVYGCSNIPSKTVTLQKFPREHSLKERWVSFVKMKRSRQDIDPHSRIFSAHLTNEDFESEVKVELGFATGLHLNDGATRLYIPNSSKTQHPKSRPNNSRMSTTTTTTTTTTSCQEMSSQESK